MRVRVSGQAGGVLMIVDTVRAVEQHLRRTEGGDHVSCHVTGTLGRDHAELHRVRVGRGILDAQSQPHGIEGSVFHERNELCAAGGSLVCDLDNRDMRGLPQSIHEPLRLKQIAVCERDVRVRRVTDGAQRRLKGMWVFTCGDKGGDVGVFACNVANDVRENRRCRHDIQALRRLPNTWGRAAGYESHGA